MHTQGFRPATNLSMEPVSTSVSHSRSLSGSPFSLSRSRAHPLTAHAWDTRHTGEGGQSGCEGGERKWVHDQSIDCSALLSGEGVSHRVPRRSIARMLSSGGNDNSSRGALVQGSVASERVACHQECMGGGVCGGYATISVCRCVPPSAALRSIWVALMSLA